MKNKQRHTLLPILLLILAFSARAGMAAQTTAPGATIAEPPRSEEAPIGETQPAQTTAATATLATDASPEESAAPIEMEREIDAVEIDAVQETHSGNGESAEEAAEPGAQPESIETPAATETTPAVAEPEAAPENIETPAETEPEVLVSPRGMRLKQRFLPTSRRIDREINKNRFVFKGETMFGLTVSYGTLSTEDADMFPIFEDIDLSGNITTVNPFVGYFYRDNRCIGVRFGYTHISGKLNSFGINLGEQNDIELEIPWLDLTNDRYSFGLFHRTYVPIDEKGRFAVFGEIELSLSTGENTFAYKSGDGAKRTSSKNTTVKAWVNPGVAVYAFPNVCATLSFGLGGFKYTHIEQYDDQGVKTGSRHYSKMNLRLNIADIRIGVTVHLWNKKKGERT